ncbi:MAG: hypothetical protein QM757_39490 [Paludibaculum sp.]
MFVRRHRAGAAAALAVALTVAVVAVAGLLTRVRAGATRECGNCDRRLPQSHEDKDATGSPRARRNARHRTGPRRAHARAARRTGAPAPAISPRRSPEVTRSKASPTLRKRLVIDYVLSGSYLVSGTPGNGRLRFDLALQDARSGAVIDNIAQSGALSDLPEMVEKAGARLREQAGYPRPGAERSERGGRGAAADRCLWAAGMW